jgi:hypothetical protein
MKARSRRAPSGQLAIAGQCAPQSLRFHDNLTSDQLIVHLLPPGSLGRQGPGLSGPPGLTRGSATGGAGGAWLTRVLTSGPRADYKGDQPNDR